MWLDVMLYLIRHGCENLCQMIKSKFGIGTDATAKKFVFLTLSELAKKHCINDDGFDEGRIYKTGDKMCLVKHTYHTCI